MLLTEAKKGFFNQPLSQNSTDIEAIKQQVLKKDYVFLFENKRYLETEFNELFSILKATDEKKYWEYCYYCCFLLEQYYTHYRHPKLQADFKQKREAIESFLKNNVKPQVNEHTESFMSYLGFQIKESITELFGTIKKTRAIREQIDFWNLGRIYWTFARLTTTNALRAGVQLGVIDKLNTMFNKTIQVEQFIHTIEKANPIFFALSVGFFLARFSINAISISKHVFFPKGMEKQLTNWQRIKDEITKRHASLLNDLVWAAANAITNYNVLFHISGGAALWLTVPFLVFDLALIIWQQHLAKQEYIARAVYYNAQLNDSEISVTDKIIIRAQLEEMEIKYRALDAKFNFQKIAAILFIVGFTSAILIPGALAATFFFGLCVLGTSLYFTAASYQNYQDKKIRLEHSLKKGGDAVHARLDYEKAQAEFFESLLMKAVMPCLILTTFAICWQAAIILTAMVLVYQLVKQYKTYSEKKELQRVDRVKKPVIFQPAAVDPLVSNCGSLADINAGLANPLSSVATVVAV